MKYDCLKDPNMGYVYRLREPVIYHVYGQTIVIPKGYISDGLSTPRICWPFVSPRFREKTLSSCLLHDRMYETHIFTRKQCDQWFRDDLIRRGVMKLIAWGVYIVLRCLGWLHW